MAPSRKAGFTLVELLVVIAILAVLMSLLTVAIDRAVYQATLAICGGGGQRGIATGVTRYSFDHKRSYPYRAVVQNPDIIGEGRHHKIAAPSYDDRPTMMSYVDLKTLVDPFCLKVDLSPTLESAVAHVYASYELWYGFNYIGLKGSKRVGDRVEWTGDAALPPAAVSLLVADMYVVMRDTGYAGNYSHPDLADNFTQYRTQDELMSWGAVQTISIWGGGGANTRFTDRNFAYDDGSVERLTNLVVKGGIAAPTWDSRLTPLPYRPAGSTTAPPTHQATYVPKR